MYDYETMSAWEALTLAKQASGLTTEEIARRSGISAHVLRRYFKPTDDGYLPSLERVPPLCRALGNAILVQWVQAQVSAAPEGPRGAASRAEVLTEVARAGAALGDVQRVLAESEASGITPVMARELRGLLEDVSREARRAADMLRSLAAARGLAEAVPLFSLDEQGRAGRPAWWRLFGRGGKHGG